MKQLLSFIIVALLFASCKSSTAVFNKTERKEKKETSKLADKIIDSASENLGIQYKTAGTTKSGYDCSGLVFTIFNRYDIALPRTSYEQAKTGIDLGKNIKEARKGDLIFFKTNNRSQINHVGIITEVTDEDVKFIHTSTSKGVILSSTKEPYYKKTFAQINRILR